MPSTACRVRPQRTAFSFRFVNVCVHKDAYTHTYIHAYIYACIYTCKYTLFSFPRAVGVFCWVVIFVFIPWGLTEDTDGPGATSRSSVGSVAVRLRPEATDRHFILPGVVLFCRAPFSMSTAAFSVPTVKMIRAPMLSFAR